MINVNFGRVPLRGNDAGDTAFQLRNIDIETFTPISGVLGQWSLSLSKSDLNGIYVAAWFAGNEAQRSTQA